MFCVCASRVRVCCVDCVCVCFVSVCDCACVGCVCFEFALRVASVRSSRFLGVVTLFGFLCLLLLKQWAPHGSPRCLKNTAIVLFSVFFLNLICVFCDCVSVRLLASELCLINLGCWTRVLGCY